MSSLNEDAFTLRLLDEEGSSGWVPPSVAGVAESDPLIPSEDQVRALLDQAREEGLAQGRADGRREYDAQIAQVTQLLNSLSQPLAELDERVELQLAGLAAAIGKQLCLFNLKQQPEQLSAVIREGLSMLPIASEKVKIKLNPDDVKRLQFSGEFSSIELVSDPSITRGGCVLVSGSSQIDQRLESRLAVLLDDMFDGEPPLSAQFDQPAGSEEGAP